MNPNNTPFTIPPSNVRNIGVELSDNNISWAYFGDQFNQYLTDPYQLNFVPSGTGKDQLLQYLQLGAVQYDHHDQL